MVTLQEIKDFLKIDHTDEDALLSAYLLSSEQFIVNSTHSNVDKTCELFGIAQRFLIAYWHENPTNVGKSSPNPFLDHILLQLKLTSTDVIL